MYGRLASLFFKLLRSLIGKDSNKAKLVLGSAWTKFGLKGVPTTIDNLFKAKSFFSKMSIDDLRVFVVSMLGAYSVTELTEFASKLSIEESKENGGNIVIANDFSSILREVTDSLAQAEKIFPELPKLDGQDGVSVSDAAILNESIENIEKLSVLQQAVELKSAVVKYKEVQSKVRRLSLLTGLRPSSALELAELINEANGSWREVIDETR